MKYIWYLFCSKKIERAIIQNGVLKGREWVLKIPYPVLRIAGVRQKID
jgi:hypothetical protein